MNAKIIDCTLREGMQTRQCSFSVEQSALIARKISEFGVDMVECGHPRISKFEINRVKAVVKASCVPVLAHARCRREDVDAVVESGAAWIGLFASFTELSLETKFNGMSKIQVLNLFKDSIVYAKSKSLSVRATIEDAGRTSLREIVELVGAAHQAGADRICFADSVGILMPGETFEVFTLLKHEFPSVVFEYHVHNDQGLALANTLEAVRAGVSWISTSCNGIGERAGITDTFQLAILLQTKYEHNRFKLNQSTPLSELIEAYSRIKRSPMQPFVGINTFTHVAKLHQIAVQKNRASYNIIEAEVVGGKHCISKDPAMHEQNLFIKPFKKSATELKYHRHGPGERFVMLDRRLLESSPCYFIARKVKDITDAEVGHVDEHIHKCDSVFMFLGEAEAYQGLQVEVVIDGQSKVLESPATVFIPAGIKHSYRFLNGSGTYINYVNEGEYNESLLEILP